MFSNNKADLKLSVKICGLEAKERIIVRYDAKIFCLPYSVPSGLLQAAVDFAFIDNAAQEAIQVGQQVHHYFLNFSILFFFVFHSFL